MMRDLCRPLLLARVLCVASCCAVVACGGSDVNVNTPAAARNDDPGGAMVAFDEELDGHPIESQVESLERQRNEAGTRWLKQEAAIATQKLEAGDAEQAFGITSTLAREGLKRKLDAVVASDVRPTLSRAATALWPKVEAEMAAQKNVRALLLARGITDIAGEDSLREKQGPMKMATAAAQRRLATAALLSSRPGSAYFHDRIAELAGGETHAEAVSTLDDVASFKWSMDSTDGCALLGDAAKEVVSRRSGKPGLIHFKVSSCSQNRNVTQSTEMRRQVHWEHTNATSTHESHLQHRSVCDKNGQNCRDEQTTHYVDDSKSTPATDQRIETMVPTQVTHTRWTLELHGTVTVDSGGEEFSAPFDVSSHDEDEDWTNEGDSHRSSDSKPTAMASSAMRSVGATVKGATDHMARKRADTFAKRAKMQTDDDDREDAWATHLRAAGNVDVDPEALAFFEKRYEIPGKQAAALMDDGNVPGMVPPFAYSLPLPKANKDIANAVQDTRDAEILRRKGFGVDLTLNAAQVTPDNLGQATSSSTTPAPAAPASDTRYAFGVGGQLVMAIEPGTEDGALLSAAVAGKFGLDSGGSGFYDMYLPLDAGYQFSRIRLKAAASIGVDRAATRDAAGAMFVGPSVYAGFGGRVGYRFNAPWDVEAGYLRVPRFLTLEDVDPVEDITNEDRFDLHANYIGGTEGGFVLGASFTRYSNDFREGHAIGLSGGLFFR